jgi:hypothetical protein
MPALIPPHLEPLRSRKPEETARLRLPATALAAVFGLGIILACDLVAAQAPVQQPPSTAGQKSAGNRANTPTRRSEESHRTKAHTPAQAVATPPAAPTPPPAPKPPDWPANDRPTPASVVWDAQGLRITANNSSLDQILHQVAQDTGAKVEGLSQDQRVFGSYGPGDPRDILSQLLDGSGYNVLMLGGQGDGAPEEIVLSIARPAGPQPPASSNQSSEDDSQVEEPPEPLPEPRPVSPAFAPGQPNAPQQLWQQMRERQLQMQREQQGNMPPEQQTPPPPNPN